MKLNELQKYILKAYTIVILFFTFFVPSTINGITSFSVAFIPNSVGHVDWVYLILIYVGITTATVALLFSFNELKKK